MDPSGTRKVCLPDGPPKRASRKQGLVLSTRHRRISPRRIRQVKARPVSVHMRRIRHMRVRRRSVLLKRVRHRNYLPQRKSHEKDASLDPNPPTTHSNVLSTKRRSAAPLVVRVRGRRSKTRSGLGMRNL